MTDLNQKQQRDQWGSKAGFIFAAAGSAVGLGNLWKFPYLTGQNGGGVFVLVYLGLVLLIGFTLMMAELVIGRATQLSPVGAFRKIKQKWAWVGAIGVLAAYLILSYYSVIGGWIIKYIVSSFTGAFSTTDLGALEGVFVNFIGAPVEPLIYHGIFMLMTLVIVMGGISGGIEKASKIMMPALFVMILAVMVRSLTLPGAMAGLEYMFKPDFSKFSMDVVLAALGQVFFSLSLGMGAMITYGSYLGKDENLVESSFLIPTLDTVFALLAGLTILPAVFALGFNPAQGPGLLFVTLPAVFAQMPLGSLFAAIFFTLVLFAAITSSISLLEAAVSLAVDEFKWNRKTATITLGILAFLIGVPSSLANGPVLGNMTFIAGTNFFDSMGIITDNILLPLAALTIAIFVGWVWGADKAVAEATNQGKIKFGLGKAWAFLIKWLAPIAIAYILISGLIPLFK